MDAERCEGQLVHRRAGRLDALERLRQRVSLSDLVVAIGADDEKVPDIRVREDMLEKLEGRRVDPLQVIEEERERVVLRGDGAEEAPEHHLESVLRLFRGELRHRRLFADDELDLRNDVRNELPMRPERASDGVAPLLELGVALAQDRPDDTPQGLREGRVRDVTLVLVELAAREQAARNGQRLVELVHQRRLADARSSRNEKQLRRAIGREGLEGRDQDLDVAFAAVQPLRNQEPVRDVLRGKGEGIDAAGRLELAQAPSQVRFHACGGLVAVVGTLGKQLQDDLFDRGGSALHALTGRLGRPRDMGVDPFRGIRGREGKLAGEHLVERDAEGVEVAPRVDRPVHLASLLGRHIGKRAGDGRWAPLLPEHPRGDAEPGQPCLARADIDQDMRRLDILVHDALLMKLAQCGGDADGHAQEVSQVPGTSD